MRLIPRFSLKLLLLLLFVAGLALATCYEFIPRYELYLERVGIESAIRELPEGSTGVDILNHPAIDDGRDMSWVETMDGKTVVNLVFLKQSDWYLVRYEVDGPDDFTAYRLPNSNLRAYRIPIDREGTYFFGGGAQAEGDVNRGEFWFVVAKFCQFLDEGTLEESGIKYKELPLNQAASE